MKSINKDGVELKIEFPEEWKIFARITISINGFKIGHSNLHKYGNEATLSNIYILEYRKQVFRFTTLFTKTVSYRNKGYGSLLLDESIS